MKSPCWREKKALVQCVTAPYKPKLSYLGVSHTGKADRRLSLASPLCLLSLFAILEAPYSILKVCMASFDSLVNRSHCLLLRETGSELTGSTLPRLEA